MEERSEPITEAPLPFYFAWLDRAGGGVVRLPRTGGLAIGRSADNDLVLEDTHVSRKHAVIQALPELAFHLVDLNSTNGTFLNHHRLLRSADLKDGDLIQIGEETFTYRENRPKKCPSVSTPRPVSTMIHLAEQPCFLMILDIQGFTLLTQTVANEELQRRVEDWVFQCRRIVEKHSGTVCKFLGDGAMLYWKAPSNGNGQIHEALNELFGYQRLSPLPFRIVVHYGSVQLGGIGPTGEQNLLGSEVNFTFRMERRASQLGEATLFSESAARNLGLLPGLRTLGMHPLKGFAGEFAFYAPKAPHSTDLL